MEDSMSKHTPGPWELDADPSAINLVWVVPTNGVKNDDYWSVCKCDGPNAKPNARLIAAAPDLLEMLTALAWHPLVFVGCEDDEEFQALVMKARAAIAKAECAS